jgi:hypothetical protein
MKPIECAPEASCGGREWAEMAVGIHYDLTRLGFNSGLNTSSLRLPRCVSTGPVAVRLAEMAI